MQKVSTLLPVTLPLSNIFPLCSPTNHSHPLNRPVTVNYLLGFLASAFCFDKWRVSNDLKFCPHLRDRNSLFEIGHEPQRKLKAAEGIAVNSKVKYCVRGGTNWIWLIIADRINQCKSIQFESSMERWWRMLRASSFCALNCWLPKPNSISTNTSQ